MGLKSGGGINVAIIGCGLIGKKRARTLRKQDRLVAVVDTVLEKAKAMAQDYDEATASTNWRAVVKRSDVGAVIVSVTNNHLAPIALACVKAGKSVLVEKPAARDVAELGPLIAAARKEKVTVQVGFNHRFHPAMRKAREIVDSGALGPLMFIRARYGHGGRLGYEREWRSNKAIAGGGELIDQGVHLIDLARWFLGDFNFVYGDTQTYFWDMKVEDNAFLHLKTPKNQSAWLHVSCSEWKNIFSFEIYGETGKLHIEGLGGSYGVERLTYYKMLPQMGIPQTFSWEYPGEDTSWAKEFEHFADALEKGVKPMVTLEDARAALEVVQAVYKRGKS